MRAMLFASACSVAQLALALPVQAQTNDHGADVRDLVWGSFEETTASGL